jgi:hypothetical protein
VDHAFRLEAASPRGNLFSLKQALDAKKSCKGAVIISAFKPFAQFPRFGSNTAAFQPMFNPGGRKHSFGGVEVQELFRARYSDNWSLNLGLLVILSGCIITAYALVSGIAIWMAGRMRGPEGQAFAGQMVADGVPEHHIDLLVHYAEGQRMLFWQASLGLLVLSVIAMVLSLPAAVYLFGTALAIDCVLFMTCRDRKRLMAMATPLERQVDVAQTLVLFGAFLVLAWRQFVNLA